MVPLLPVCIIMLAAGISVHPGTSTEVCSMITVFKAGQKFSTPPEEQNAWSSTSAVAEDPQTCQGCYRTLRQSLNTGSRMFNP